VVTAERQQPPVLITYYIACGSTDAMPTHFSFNPHGHAEEPLITASLDRKQRKLIQRGRHCHVGSSKIALFGEEMLPSGSLGQFWQIPAHPHN
jgi:hypothetical protein